MHLMVKQKNRIMLFHFKYTWIPIPFKKIPEHQSGPQAYITRRDYWRPNRAVRCQTVPQTQALFAAQLFMGALQCETVFLKSSRSQSWYWMACVTEDSRPSITCSWSHTALAVNAEHHIMTLWCKSHRVPEHATKCVGSGLKSYKAVKKISRC